MASTIPEPSPLDRLDTSALPRHLAVIMDGNGRWAKSKGWRRVRGHEEGAESVRVVVRACRKLGIKVLTLYAFSEENWARPKTEVEALMRLLGRFLKSERQEMIDRGIRLMASGSVERLPTKTRELLQQIMDDTAGGERMVLNLALSYGGRQELVRAARRLAARAVAGELVPEAIGEAELEGELYTAGLPQVDLLIRTSGELRVSNFLLWQIAYAEFYFTETYWPDFREQEMAKALTAFAERERRFGQTGEQLKGESA